MVDRSEVDNMLKILAVINGESPAAHNIGMNSQNSAKIAQPEMDNSEKNVSAMKEILEKFTSVAGRASDQLVNETSMDRPLREAMTTEETDDGVIIGSYKITAKNVSSSRKLYDVTHLNEINAIATDLTLYEAARGLVLALNDGLPITSPEIRNILMIESEYANALHDAIHAKHALRKGNLTESKKILLEDKYSSAVRRAKGANSRLVQMVERYPFQ